MIEDRQSRRSPMPRKYTPAVLLPALRLFAKARQEAVSVGFTDNGGAIHSAERIIDLLGLYVCYPNINHHNQIKHHKNAEISVAAQNARNAGEKVDIEHVMPQRAFAIDVLTKIENGYTDLQIIDYIRTTYRLVVLHPDETKLFNKINRSKLSKDRIADAGIHLYNHPTPQKQ
jgi:hypothetical protein